MTYDPIQGLTVAVERLTEKMDKQGDKIEELSKEMRLLIANQIEIKELRESLGRSYRRLEAVEHAQNTDGCSAHKNFVALRNEQLIHFKELAHNCKQDHDTLETRIEVLEQKPMKLVDKFVLAIVAVVGAGIGSVIMAKLGVKQ